MVGIRLGLGLCRLFSLGNGWRQKRCGFGAQSLPGFGFFSLWLKYQLRLRWWTPPFVLENHCTLFFSPQNPKPAKCTNALIWRGLSKHLWALPLVSFFVLFFFESKNWIGISEPWKRSSAVFFCFDAGSLSVDYWTVERGCVEVDIDDPETSNDCHRDLPANGVARNLLAKTFSGLNFGDITFDGKTCYTQNNVPGEEYQLLVRQMVNLTQNKMPIPVSLALQFPACNASGAPGMMLKRRTSCWISSSMVWRNSVHKTARYPDDSFRILTEIFKAKDDEHHESVCFSLA